MFATVFLRKQLGLVAGTTREDIISCFFFVYLYCISCCYVRYFPPISGQSVELFFCFSREGIEVAWSLARKVEITVFSLLAHSLYLLLWNCN